MDIMPMIQKAPISSSEHFSSPSLRGGEGE